MTMTLRPQPALVLAGYALALSAALSGCSGSVEPPRTPSPSGGSADPSHDDGARAARVSDCRNEGASGLPDDAEVVPCVDLHDEEVFHVITLTERAFAQETVDAAVAECVGDPFTAFVGVAKEASSLEVYPIAPTSATWDQTDGRVVICVLFDPAGPVAGSLQGAAR